MIYERRSLVRPPQTTDLLEFLAALVQQGDGPITKQEVLEYLDSMRPSLKSLQPYSFFRSEGYTRNLIFRNECFEVLALCWSPGSKTPVHSHNGQLGWMAAVQGEIKVTNYRYVSCSTPERQQVAGMDCLAGGSDVVLEPEGCEMLGVGSPTAVVDKVRTIHQVENLEKSRSGSITLHVYSLPVDSCVAFDMNSRRCFRRSLFYDTRDGRVLENNSIPPTPFPIVHP